MVADSSPAAARKRFVLAAIVIAAVTIAVFARCINHPFLTWDDRYHVVDNPHFDPPTVKGTLWFWSHSYGNLYAPMSYSVFTMETALSTKDAFGEPSPGLFHLVQITLHAASAVMVFFILLRLFPERIAGAACGALIFAVHPLQVESVAWISETRGILAGFFGIAAILLWLRCRWIFAGLAMALAMLSKPSAVATPIIALALLPLVDRRRARLLALAPWFLMAIAMLIVTRRVQIAAEIPVNIAWWQRPIIALDAIGFYLSKALVPINLAADYARTPSAVLSGAVSRWVWSLPAVLATVLIIFRRDRVVLVASLVFLGALVPVLGLATFHYQVISTVADRYAQLAMIGVALILAGKVPWKILAPICAALAVLSIVQCKTWSSDEALWSRATAMTPNSAVAWNNLGFAQCGSGEFDEAIDAFTRALSIDPKLLTAQTNLEEARADKSLRDSHEEHSVAQWIQLGVQLARENEVVLAGAAFRKAIALDPKNGVAFNNYGLLRLQQRRPREAIPLLRRAVVLMPDNRAARDNFEKARTLLPP